MSSARIFGQFLIIVEETLYLSIRCNFVQFFLSSLSNCFLFIEDLFLCKIMIRQVRTLILVRTLITILVEEFRLYA